MLHPGATATSFTWNANVPAGTEIIFMMTDAQGRSGGSSDIELVALSNDNSCLNGNYPSSTATAAPSSTAMTSTTTTSTATPTQTSSSSSGVSIGAIAGTAAGVVVAVAALVTLALFCIKKRRGNRSPYGHQTARSSRHLASIDLDPATDNFQHAPIYPFPYQTDSVSRLAPPIVPASATASSFHQDTASFHQEPYNSLPVTPASQVQHSRMSSNTESFAGFGEAASSSMSSGARRKAAMAGVTGYQPPARFIVHTDAEDIVPENSELVELPPQYTERRAPVPPLVQDRPMSSVKQYTSTDLAYASGAYTDEPPQSTAHPPPL